MNKSFQMGVVALAAVIGVLVGFFFGINAQKEQQAVDTARLPYVVSFDKNSDYVITAKSSETPAQMHIWGNGVSFSSCGVGQHFSSPVLFDGHVRVDCAANPILLPDGSKHFGGS